MLENLESSLTTTAELMGALKLKAREQPDEITHLKNLLRALIGTVSAYQNDLTNEILRFCEDPIEDEWHSLVTQIHTLATNVRRMVKLLEEEEGDFLIEKKGIYRELVLGMSSRERVLKEIQSMSYPPSSLDLSKLRIIACHYNALITSLKQDEFDLAEYLRNFKQATATQPQGPNDTKTDVVILVHGIRDFALWQNTIRSSLEKNGFAVEATNYGRLNLFQFLFPADWFRRYALRTVSKQLKMVALSYPNKRISVIAHSFGTYVIACLLRDEFDIRFHRIIFCGSVVSYDFPFENCVGRFQDPLLNEVGTEDIWPAVAESVTPSFGSAGTYGFRRPYVRDRWHNGASQGYFLSPDFATEFWIPFLSSGVIAPGSNPAAEPGRLVQLISVFKLRSIVGAAIMLTIVIVALHLLPWPGS